MKGGAEMLLIADTEVMNLTGEESCFVLIDAINALDNRIRG